MGGNTKIRKPKTAHRRTAKRLKRVKRVDVKGPAQNALWGVDKFHTTLKKKKKAR